MTSFAVDDDAAERGLGCGSPPTQLISESEAPPAGRAETAVDCGKESKYSEFLKKECLGFEDRMLPFFRSNHSKADT